MRDIETPHLVWNIIAKNIQTASMTDYLVVGGGLAGCVVATRLKQYNPAATVTLVEAGPDAHDREWMTETMGTFNLHMSEFEYNYLTVPQKHYDGRRVFNAGGKQLPGSSSVNFASKMLKNVPI